MVGPVHSLGRRIPRRAADALKAATVRRIPEHYLTPTADYAVQKALKDVTSRVFMALDRVGIHLLPKHFYTPVPDYAWLRTNRPYWDGRARMTGVRWNLDEQLQWLVETCSPYLHEVAGLGTIDAINRDRFGPGFGPIDAQVLHCFMRRYHPRRVVEIGSGASTAIMIAASQANERDGEQPSRITSIDPYSTKALRSTGAIEIIEDFVQRASQELFDQLGDGDLLFIDSSHAVKIGSDVVHLFLEVIPRLAQGAFVHVHDVSLPYLYPRSALSDYFGWQETTLLLALMTGNPALQPLAALSALHYDRTDELRELLPDYQPQQNEAGLRSGNWVHAHFPDSMWLRIV